MTTNGRGAWTTDGGTTPYYELHNPNVGSQVCVNTSLDPNSFDYRAVNYGVKAIQSRINELGYSPALVVDGWLGPNTSNAIKWLQSHLGVTADGQLGPATAKAMFRAVVVAAENKFLIPGHHLGGIMMHESEADPGAVGYNTYWDKGLFQWNCDPTTNPSYTVAEAFNYHWATSAAAQRLASAQTKYSGKGSALQTDCSIAQHNSPYFASLWWETGTPPNQQIQDYVTAVLSEANHF